MMLLKKIQSLLASTLTLLPFMFMIVTQGITLSACSEAPQCVPGRSVSCPCIPSGQGVQRCAEDGSRYLECECGHLPSPIKSFDEVSVASSSARPKKSSVDRIGEGEEIKPINKASASLLTKAIPTGFTAQGTAEAATLDQRAGKGSSPAEVTKVIRKASKAPRVVPLAAEIVEANDKKSSSSPKVSATKMFKLNLRNQQKEWWFFSETLERCVLADNVNGIDYAPLKLLSEGCYRLGGEGLMVIRCDDPPLGPKTYRFAEQKRECVKAKSEAQERERAKRAKRTEKPVQIAALDPVIEAKTDDPQTSDQQPTSTQDNARSWHCMCYEEVVKGEPTLSTACRPSKEMCRDLSEKVKEGSKILVQGSLLAGCQERKGASPWRLFKGKGSRRYFWQPSSHPGAWWSAEGCFLPVSKKRLKAWNAKRSNKRPKSERTITSKRPQKRAREEVPPPELYKPIGSKRSLIRFGEKGSAPRAERCREACRANLISAKERRAEYGLSDVPPLLRWGKAFSDRVKLVKTICMSNQGKAKRGRERCLKKVINKCSIYCERAEE